ncbi:MAG TPA: CDP-paratose 2-epimerase [Planctomycetaceae bacterium]|nr:CDP-paratose 2-epimerase [Planctomycetaceae bacterium]
MKPQLRFSCSPHDRAVSRLVARTWLPAPIETIFGFFADASNLEKLTPAWLRFRIVTPIPIEMTNGTTISYRLRVHGLPITWKSEIRDWSPPFEFVDTQLNGPYRYWHHRHSFSESNGGTLVDDEVDYCPPGGRIVDRLFVRRDLRRIFSFRTARLNELFNAAHSAPADMAPPSSGSV